MAGAVLGVLATLLTLATLGVTLDEHYVTRREYVATLKGIQGELYYLRTGRPPAPNLGPVVDP